MKLDVSKAFRTPATPFPFQAQVTLPPQDVLGDTVIFDPVELSGTYLLAEDTLRVEGTLSTVAHGTCALCMERADAPVQVAFAETFRKDANEAEDECFRYEGKEAPLDHMTLTLVMLNLPMRFTCSVNCQGSPELQAWRDENPQSSSEDGVPTGHPFEALQSLFNNDEEV